MQKTLLEILNEQLLAKAKYCNGTSGGAALKAVIKACKLLDAHRGSLDFENCQLACFSLMATLTMEHRRDDILIAMTENRIQGAEVVIAPVVARAHGMS